MVDDEGYEARHEALHKGTRLEWFTVFWNVIEVVVTVSLGVAAGSLSLVAYGLDSLIEVFASLVVISYIANHESGGRAARALKLVAAAFGLLAFYLIISSSISLVEGQPPASSPLGVAYLVIAATAMFVLAVRKRRLAQISGSAPLAAEASLTFLDGCLAVGILTALLLSGVAGIWWADPAAALLVGVLCIREMIDSLREAKNLSPESDDIERSLP
jgi:divalent metal cation (Fe/Co/Zn/Cd) transporter